MTRRKERRLRIEYNRMRRAARHEYRRMGKRHGWSTSSSYTLARNWFACVMRVLPVRAPAAITSIMWSVP